MFEQLHVTPYKLESHKPEQVLLDLTNKFLQDFFDLYSKTESATGKRKFDDGYAFHHVLADCLVFSDYSQNVDPKENQLIGMSCLEGELVKGMFERNLKSITDDLLFIIKNYDKQPQYQDWKAHNLKTSTKTIQVERFNIDVMIGKAEGEPIYKEDAEELTVYFMFHNSKNSHTEQVTVIFHNNELDRVSVKNFNNDLILRINKHGKPEVQHYKYIADINSFLHTLDQVYCLIKENLKGE